MFDIKRHIQIIALFCSLTSIKNLSGAPLITEFMASNSHTLADEDGTYSDWIEIRNPDSSVIDLNGWFLTDDLTQLTKWQFPDISLASDQHLVIFASSKNRSSVGAELHTNFKLSKGGENLALVMPDGITIVSQYSSYPAQITDVSYGTSTPNKAIISLEYKSIAETYRISEHWRKYTQFLTGSSWLDKPSTNAGADNFGRTGFFKQPTPNHINGNHSSIGIPQKVTFSPSSRPFLGNITVRLSGNDTEQTIRYTIDGSTPTTSSKIAPETICVKSTQRIRAAVFSSDGCKGPINDALYKSISGPSDLETASRPLQPYTVTKTNEKLNSLSYYRISEPDPNSALASLNREYKNPTQLIPRKTDTPSKTKSKRKQSRDKQSHSDDIPKIIISELNYHPLKATKSEKAISPNLIEDQFEWIEINNVSNKTINLRGTKVKFGPSDDKNDVELSLKPISLPPKSRALVVADLFAFQLRYGKKYDSIIAGEWKTKSLPNSTGSVTIIDPLGNTLTKCSYKDSKEWPSRADGKGSTLEYIGTSYRATDYLNPKNWRASSEINGSPGRTGSDPDQRVVINEILTHTDLPLRDSIELYNTTNSAINVGGWYLSDTSNIKSEKKYRKFKIPKNTIIQGKGYLVFDEYDFNPGGGKYDTDFSLKGSKNDHVWLISADSEDKLIHFIDHIKFGAALNGVSLGRSPNDHEKSSSIVTPLRSITLGSSNDLPSVGKIMISEIHTNLSDQDSDLKFIEIVNTSGKRQPLNHWTIRGLVEFDFKNIHHIPAGGVIVIVPFDPEDTTKKEKFKSHFNINQDTILIGPWTPQNIQPYDMRKGKGKGKIILHRADSPPAEQPDFYPQVIEDQINYDTNDGWIIKPNFSLNRIGPKLYGNSASNWLLKAPTPGISQLGYHVWIRYYFPAMGKDSHTNSDSDQDGLSNLEEYVRNLNPTKAENHIPALTDFKIAGDYLNFSTISLESKKDVSLIIQTSSNLANWNNVVPMKTSSDNGKIIRQYRLPYSIDKSQYFIRLKMMIDHEK